MAVAALASMFRTIAAARINEIFVDHREIAHWPAGLLEALNKQGLLTIVPDAQSTICPGCARACIMKVERIEVAYTPTPADFVICDKPENYGLIEIDRHALDQWCMTRERIETCLARELRLRVRSRDGARDRIRFGTSAQFGKPITLEFAATAELLIGDDRFDLVDLLLWDQSGLKVDRQLFGQLIHTTRASQSGSKAYQRSKRLQALGREATAYRDNLLQIRAGHLKQEHPLWTKPRIARELKKTVLFADVAEQRIARIIRTRKK